MENQNNVVKVENLIEVNKNDIVATFCDNEKLAGFIDLVRQEVKTDRVNLSSDRGRKEIASRAHKVSKIKSALTKLLDSSLDETKSLIKTANMGKKFLTLELDQLRDITRQPLNAWEADEKIKEDVRVNEIEERILGILSLGNLPKNPEKQYIAEMIEAVDNIDCSVGFDEFTQDALRAQSTTKSKLSSALNAIIQKELEEKQRIEFEAKKKELEEKQRDIDLKTKAQERLNNLKSIPITLIGKSAFEIKTKIDNLETYQADSNHFGDLYEDAKQAVTQVLAQLGAMLDQQKLVEESQKKQEAEILASQTEESTPPPETEPTPSVEMGAQDPIEDKHIPEPAASPSFEFMSRECVEDMTGWGVKHDVTLLALEELEDILKDHFSN